MLIRHATMDDLTAIATVEAACFPAAEAAGADALRNRLAVYPDCFWLMIDDGRNGDVIPVDAAEANDTNDTTDCGSADATDRTHDGVWSRSSTDRDRSPDLADAMYDDAGLHEPDGAWQMIFGVDTAPAYRHHGYASTLMRRVIDDARAAGRAGLVLTCKDRLIGFYARFGYQDEGVSESTHGNVVWHQMRLRFCPDVSPVSFPNVSSPPGSIPSTHPRNRTE